MTTTLADIVKDCTLGLEWKSSSQWATPHPNDLYTSTIKVYHNAEWTGYISFHVSLMRLILCEKFVCAHSGKVDTKYFDMGDFAEPIASDLSQLVDTANKIKEYATYVVAGIRKYGNLGHCPSFELIDNVDENFNPIY